LIAPKAKELQELSSKDRQELKNKMAEALNDRIQTLSAGLQDILIDDLVTAFEIRFAVLNRAQSEVHLVINVGMKITQ
jgi:hypothetical protein